MTSPIPSHHQEFAVDRIAQEESLLVEYGTGTGKTKIIIETCQLLVAAGEVPVLVVVPNSLMRVGDNETERQFQRWAGDAWTRRHVEFLDSTLSIYQRREKLKRGHASVYVISTESMSYALIREGIRYRSWGAVIIDEASRFRNYSKRTITLKAAGSAARSRYAFTGNLTVRNPADGWYVMNFLEPGLFGTTSRETFITEYCLLGGFNGMTPTGVRPEKLEKLTRILDSKRIKCELRDIRDLPPRTLSVRTVDLVGAQKDAYIQMREELKVEIQRTSAEEFESKASTYGVRLLRLQEIAAGFARNTDGDVEYLPSPKTAEMVDTLIDSPSIPTVIWYWWQPELDVIRMALLRQGLAFSVLGEGSAIQDFRDGKTDILVAQLSSGGYGLNLQRATRMMYHSLCWDMDTYYQSQERNVRLDTTADHLEIIHYVVHNTVDEYVRQKLVDKAEISLQLSRSQALELLAGS